MYESTNKSFIHGQIFHPASVAVIGAFNANFNLGATMCKTLKEDIRRDFVIEAIGELGQICRQYGKPAAIYPFNARSRIMSVRMESQLPLFDTAEEAVRALEVSHEQFTYQRKKEYPSWTRS
jgi:hypothetical protein